MKFSSLASATMALVAGVVTAQPAPYKYERLNRNDSVLAIVDMQVGLFNGVRDYDPITFHRALISHAMLGKAFDLPVVMTTSVQVGPTGPMLGEIAKMFPNATMIERHGEINAMDDPRFAEALKATGKKQVIIAGIYTDVCVAFAAQSMREAGYSVWANIEASGTSSAIVRDATNQLLRDAGIKVMSWAAITAELLYSHTANISVPMFVLMEQGIPSTGFLARSHRDALTSGVMAPGVEHLP